jgi:hypothetical protein
MGKYRTLSESNQYYLPKHTYLTCIHYALQYRDWIALLNTERDTRGAIRYDKDHVQTSGDYDSTSETAIRMIGMTDRVSKVDQCIELACEDKEMEKWLRLGVCYGFTIYQLLEEGMPCGKNMYYNLRQRFYYELSKKI